MIEINLLPEDLRKRKKKIDLPKIPLLPAVSAFLAILLVVYLVMGLAVGLKKRTLRRLTKRWEDLAPQKNEVELLKTQINSLNRKVEIIDQLTVNRILWAKKLNDLSSLITSGVWLNSLSLDVSNRCLVLKGTVASKKGEEMASVGKFMRVLKEDKSFFEEFANLELVSIQRRKIKNVEVIDFTLKCHFRTDIQL